MQMEPTMNHSPLSLFLCFLITSTIAGSNPTHFTPHVSINCGSTGASDARSGRKWVGDVRPKLASLLESMAGFSTAATVIPKSADPVPHSTARISRSQFSYAFQVNPGQIIIRLHFNPAPIKGFRGFRDLFAVRAGPFTLLSNFSASLNAAALGVDVFTKEYCLNVHENQRFRLTFSPESSQSLDTYAFINGIEIITVPASLSYFHDGDIGLQVVGKESLVYVDNKTALEIIHRVNIKQDIVPSTGDFDGLFPKWATQEVEREKTSTWKIPVEVGFRYLIRLHFSETELKIAGTGDVVFKVLINGMVAQTNSDMLKTTDGNYYVLYRDYIVTMRGLKEDGKHDLFITLQSNDELRDRQGVLTGFEVVKVSNPDNSLASPNPLPPPQHSPSLAIKNSLSILGYRNAISAVALIVISLLSIVVHKLREIWEACSIDEEIRPSAKAEQFCRRFSLTEIRLATKDFNEGLIIGRGGFGKVYKGLIDKGQKTVAIKRLKPNSQQGAREFLTEIETLCELRHMNLVSLIGYCIRGPEMILVYEYMPSGTLADHLYKLARHGHDSSSLTWKQRLNICIGAARGLDYLHTGHRIIHRDVKASNILLDEEFVAKVADFGLAKLEDRSRLQSHVSTKVKGTFGYFDPYYLTTQKLTRKSDTYAFGVVMFEALCGRPAVDSGFSEDERVLTMWARDMISEGEVNQIVDLSLREEISSNSLKIFVEVAEKCLEVEPKNRPTMSQIVLQLESALEQQENRKFATPNHIAHIVANDVCPSNEEDIITSSESDRRSTDLQAVIPPTKQPNINFSPADQKKTRKPKTYSPLRFSGWRAFWNRIIRYDLQAGMMIEPSDTCRHFSLDEIRTATRNFDESYIISMGGYGKTYKGLIDGATTVAIKRWSLSSSQEVNVFLTEIKMLSKIRHRHLVPLIGYCNEYGEMMVVHEYMAHGTLRDHLYNSKTSPLTWIQRLEICLGAAKGLHYLHTGAKQTIIHRDVKSSNILLDEQWAAKICDFSLSKFVEGDNTHVSTVVKGSFGYLDPEYYRRQQLTVKSDVYSFGVVLLEVLCGRPPIIISNLPEERVNLANWAMFKFREGRIEEIIDSNLKGQIKPEALRKFAETAVGCLEDRATDRPSMGRVVWNLECILRQEWVEFGASISI